MFSNGQPINDEEIADKFGDQFEDKITKIEEQTVINRNVYNGSRKMEEEDSNFMSETEIMEAVPSLKMKHSEGYDRIPQRVIIDDNEIELDDLNRSFNSFKVIMKKKYLQPL